MSSHRFGGLAVVALTLFSGAQAQTSLNFESLNDGDALTTQFSGLAFSNASVLTAGFSLNDLDFPAHSGKNVVSDTGGPISIAFAPPVTTFAAYFTHAVALTVTAYDAGGSVVATASSNAVNTRASGNQGTSPNE